MPFKEVYTNVSCTINRSELLFDYYYNDNYQSIKYDKKKNALVINSFPDYFSLIPYISIETDNHIYNINVIFYDDDTLWIGFNLESNANSGTEKYFLMVNLATKEYKFLTSEFNVLHIYPVGLSQKYWIYNKNKHIIDDKHNGIYKWDDIVKLSNDIKPYKSFEDDTNNKIYKNLYAINWKGASFVGVAYNPIKKTFANVVDKLPDKTDIILHFLDENLNEMFEKDATSFFPSYKSIYQNGYKKENVFNFVSINDNCLFYYEGINLDENKYQILKNGLDNKYLYDFTNDKVEEFTPIKIDFYASSGTPFRDKDGCKVLMAEYYPAGSWYSIYLPHSLEENKIFVKELANYIFEKKYDEGLTYIQKFLDRCFYGGGNNSIEECFFEKLKLFKDFYDELCKSTELIHQRDRLKKKCKTFCQHVCINIMNTSDKINDNTIFITTGKRIIEFIQYYYDYQFNKQILITKDFMWILSCCYDAKIEDIKKKDVPRKIGNNYRVYKL